MLGLLVLGTLTVMLAGYFWLLRATVRYAKRKTGSNLVAALAVLAVLVLTFGDTVFNRWYHREVLCKREDVGVKVFETVALPAEYWNEKNNYPKLPYTEMLQGKPFLGRYVIVQKYESGGSHPFTAYFTSKSTVIDIQTNRTLSQFADYAPQGGLWWTWPLKFIGTGNAIGWTLSRGNFSWCLPNSINKSVTASYGAFKKTTGAAKK